MNATTTQPQGNGTLVKIDTNRPLAVPELRTVFLRQIPEMEKCFPKHLKSEAARLARAVITEVAGNEKLMKCTGMSLLKSAIVAAQLNLEIGGPLAHGYLVPYWSNKLRCFEAQYQLGYKGMCALAFRSTHVASITPQIVREGDEFEEINGSDAKIVHKKGAIRGKVTHYYTVVKFKGGGENFKVMTPEECDEHRKKFSKNGTNKETGAREGNWLTNFDAMCLKTTVRMVLKTCPFSVSLPPDLDEGDEIVDTIPTDDPLESLPPHDEHGEITEGSGRTEPRQVAADDMPPEETVTEAPKQTEAPKLTDEAITLEAARLAASPKARDEINALKARKGVSWEACIAWVNKEFDADFPHEGTAYGKLPEMERKGLAEWLLTLPDTRK